MHALAVNTAGAEAVGEPAGFGEVRVAGQRDALPVGTRVAPRAPDRAEEEVADGAHAEDVPPDALLKGLTVDAALHVASCLGRRRAALVERGGTAADARFRRGEGAVCDDAAGGFVRLGAPIRTTQFGYRVSLEANGWT